MNSNMARLREELTATIQSEDVRGWLYKCEQFFEIDHVSDPHKIQLASIHLYGAASLWHRQFVKLMGGNASWDSFKEVDLIDLPEDQQINFYIAGLQSDVELVVRMYRPKSLAEVYHLSKIQEAAIKVNKQSTHNFLDIDKAKKLGCQLCNTCPLQVDIVGGAKSTSTSIPTPIENVLPCFEDVFVVPTALPLMREFDHKIVLKKGTEPIFSRHYRHPPTQKDAIEVMVKELMLLRAHTLCAKQSKCVFGAKRVEYLGHVITGAGVATDESKIVAMKQWPVPSNLKQLRGFLGLTEEIQSAFLNLKEAMVSALVLKLPNFDEPFMVETYSSGEGIGAAIPLLISDYSPTQMKWLPKLMGFDYEIQYKKGSDNGDANALSRVDTCGQLLQMAGKPISKHYSWSHNQLRRKGKLVVGNDADLTMSLLTHFHCDSTGGDYGVAVTTQRIQSFCYWKKLKKHISMDFVEGLSNSHIKTVIMVVVDRLSKYSHFMALSRPFTAIQFAQLFLDNIYKLHGLPKVTVDGHTEVVNRCLECYLKCMTGEKPKEWAKWLPLVKYWYNTNFHTSIKTTPFEAVFGQPPTSPILYCLGQSKLDIVDRSLAASEAIIQMLQFHLEMAQSRKF
ncbi:putative mitochondrial protein [Tanacetum coccineum]